MKSGAFLALIQLCHTRTQGKQTFHKDIQSGPEFYSEKLLAEDAEDGGIGFYFPPSGALDSADRVIVFEKSGVSFARR